MINEISILPKVYGNSVYIYLKSVRKKGGEWQWIPYRKEEHMHLCANALIFKH